ncbi:cation transporter dimerization domain-containing protein [Metasolibacillus sp. FSL K6-0083]|uniref:cation transporter dimerization domain-containing protein n=1 Tax=Metasolibacillus sp. FSL K6-0083 TaxID=2921416 RepID=UPI00315B3300
MHTLTDGFNTEDTEALCELIRKVDGVSDLVDFKGRSHGNMSFVDVTVTVNPYLNVWESHEITEQIENTIKKFNPYCVVLVHIEPHEIPAPKEDDYHF